MSISVSASVTVVSPGSVTDGVAPCVEVEATDLSSLSSAMAPWRDVGREFGREAGRDIDRAGLDTGMAAIMLLRLDTTESARVKLGGEVTLHRLTLSDLFIMALCTNPPSPLVGEVILVGEALPVLGEADVPVE